MTLIITSPLSIYSILAISIQDRDIDTGPVSNEHSYLLIHNLIFFILGERCNSPR